MTDNNLPEIEACWNKIGVCSGANCHCSELIKFGHCRNCPVYSKNARKLFDRPMSEAYQQELISFNRKSEQQKRQNNKSAFLFKAGKEWLALDSSLVTEVVDMGPIHSIPHKNSRIFRGIVNIRGRLELCVSLGGILRLEARSKSERGGPSHERLIVSSKDGQSVVFPVTEVIGIIKYQPSMISQLPINISGAKAVYINGILSYQDKEVGYLDDNILFRVLTINLS